jgi:uncharacterized protein (DUF488 family)
MAPRLLTLGHGAAPQDELAALLRSAGVDAVVDIRRAPGSRRHPHVARTALAEWLPALGVTYRWEEALGGWLRASPGSAHTALRNASFRGYAEWMETPEFAAALRLVLDEAAARRTAVLCSESLWWRCHRRLVADAATLLHGAVVEHLQHDGRLAPHALTEGVRREGGALVYDGGAAPLDGLAPQAAALDSAAAAASRARPPT